MFAFLLASCAPTIRSTLGRAPTAAELASFWTEPAPGLDTFHGSGGRERAPHPDVVYKLVERKDGGFSPKLEVEDPRGLKWSVKLGDEAQSEVTSSRIVWAAGYRQPPEYYLVHWRMDAGKGTQHMGPARFRPHLPDLDSQGPWSWRANPFVESRAFNGLIALMMILNSSDLKDENNEIYEVRDGGQVQKWYTVKDLGATLGQTGRIRPQRNDIDYFEKQAFIRGLDGPFVRFEFHGRHQWLMRHIRISDVEWICRRLQRFTPKQWQDAFRAGGYDQATTERYLAKIDDKIRQGLSLGKGDGR